MIYARMSCQRWRLVTGICARKHALTQAAPCPVIFDHLYLVLRRLGLFLAPLLQVPLTVHPALPGHTLPLQAMLLMEVMISCFLSIVYAFSLSFHWNWG